MMTDELKEKIETKENPYADHLVSTKHCVMIKGKEIHYTATIGTLVLKEEVTVKEGEKKDQYEGEKPRAELFFVAYTLDDPEDISKRPLTFSFNGGPGSSSIWVHMGFIGPRRVKLDEDGNPINGLPELVDNEYSILDMSDIVFVDPIGTGYSRTLKGDKPSDFWGWQKDLESVGDFIRLYVTRNQRWSSPKYIAGESYGTTRAVGLADYLSEKHKLYLNGLMLVSTALDFSTLDFYPGHELPYVLYLPTYAADAHYHKKLSAEYQEMPVGQFVSLVREFAANEYRHALFVGDKLPEDEKERVAEKLSAFTGLSKTWLLQCNLRVEIFRFCKELLRERRQVIGRIDSRYVGTDVDAAGENFEDDPSSYLLAGVFGASFNDYVSRELDYHTDIPYCVSSDLWAIWNYKEYSNRFLQLQDMLRKNMVRNPWMKVWVLNGYYDLATPFFASEYVFDHLSLEPSYREKLMMTYYESGHMIYLHLPSLRKFRKEAEEFYKL